MILTALNAYKSEETVPPGYARKPLGFELSIDEDAKGCLLSSLYVDDSGGPGKIRSVAPQLLVPNIARSNNPPPMLGCDNASFVLGQPKAAKTEASQPKEERSAARNREAFTLLIQEFADETDDPTAQTFLAWDAAGRPGLEQSISRLADPIMKRLAVDLIAVRVVGRRARLHDSPEAISFWSSRAVSARGGELGWCVSCSQLRPVVPTLPQSLIGALIPGTSTANVALMSVNFPSASRGASGTGLRSAPVCAICATGAVQAFNALAGSPDHRWGTRGDDKATIWWVKGEADVDDILSLDRPEPTVVKKILESVPRGVDRPGDMTADRFYALTFSGNVARLVIRDWLDLPLRHVHGNIRAWFEHTATPALDRSHFPLRDLAKSCGSLVRRDGRWVETPPEGLQEALLRTAVAGVDLPRNALVRAVARAKAEIHYVGSNDGLTAHTARRRMDARFGVIRLCLNRTVYKEKPMDTHLDESREDPPYLSGRLFAMRESLQYRALGHVNASVTDRYFDRASSYPASVEHALAALEQQHLRTIFRKQGDRVGTGASKRLTETHARAGEAPGRMSVQEQAAWIAGYYQQRQFDFASASASARATKAATAVAEASTTNDKDI